MLLNVKVQILVAGREPALHFIPYLKQAVSPRQMMRPSSTIMTVMAILLSASLCVLFAISSVFAGGGERLQVPFFVGDDKVDLIYEYDLNKLQFTS